MLATENMTKVHVDDKDIEVPVGYPLAWYFLVRMQGSPYYQQNKPEFNDADTLTAGCIEHGRQRALDLLVPMAQAGPFDPESFTQWRWSKKPGAYERQLQRRHNNPLFSPESRIVTAKEVYEARLLDDQDQAAYRKDVAALIESMPDELPFDWHTFLNGMREKIDNQIERSAGIGGDINDVIEALRKMRTNIINTWRIALGNNKDALAALEKAEKFVNAPEYVEMLGNEFFRQLCRKNGPIPPTEVLPSLLTENPETIRVVVKFLGGEGGLIKKTQTAAAELIAECALRGEEIDQAAEKLEALGIVNAT